MISRNNGNNFLVRVIPRFSTLYCAITMCGSVEITENSQHFWHKFRESNVFTSHSVEKYYKTRSHQNFFRQIKLQKFMKFDLHKWMIFYP